MSLELKAGKSTSVDEQIHVADVHLLVDPDDPSITDLVAPKTKYTFNRLVVATIKKNLKIQKRSRLANCCILLTPMILFSFFGLLSVLITLNNPDVSEPQTEYNGPFVPGFGNNTASGNLSFAPFPGPPPGMFFSPQYIVTTGPNCNDSCKEWVGQNPRPNPSNGFVNKTGLLGSVTQWKNFTFPGGPPPGWWSSVALPVFHHIDGGKQALDDYLSTNLVYLEQQNSVAIQYESEIYSRFFDAALVFEDANIFDGTLNFSVSTDYDIGRSLSWRPDPLLGFRFRSQFQALYTTIVSSVVNRGWIQYLQSNNFSAIVDPVSAQRLSSITASYFGVVYSESNLDGLLDGVVLIFLPFTLSFLFPIYAGSTVQEKELRLTEYQLQMGMSRLIQVLVVFIYNFFFYVLVVIVLMITLVIWSSRLITQTEIGVLLPVFLLWGTAQISMSFLYATFWNKSKPATIGAVLLVFISVITMLVLNGTTWPIEDDLRPPLPFYLFPIFAFCRSIYIIHNACSNLSCLTINDAFASGAELNDILLMLAIDTVWMLLAAVYLEYVLPREYGTPKHPLFFLEPIGRALGLKKSEQELLLHIQTTSLESSTDEETSISAAESGAGASTTENLNMASIGGKSSGKSLDRRSSSALLANGEDPATRKDAEEIQSMVDQLSEGNFTGNVPYLMVNQLQKVYPSKNGAPAHHAVKGVSFKIFKNSIVALLGANGAGKSTTLNMITSMVPITSGGVYFKGAPISDPETNSQFHKSLGICPQHDIFWPNLTVTEQVSFFARAKGVEEDVLPSHVIKLLTAVGLADKTDALMTELSGGMRRRVSIACAYTGNPQIVVLDESTTGLDPEIRSQLSQFFALMSKDRSTLLITHNLAEAEELSQRIVIMAEGNVVASDSALALKVKFANGFTLAFDLVPGVSIDTTTSYLNSFLPWEYTIAEQFPGKLVISIAELKISKCFEIMQNVDKTLISQWSVGLNTLETVFLNLIKAAASSK